MADNQVTTMADLPDNREVSSIAFVHIDTVRCLSKAVVCAQDSYMVSLSAKLMESLLKCMWSCQIACNYITFVMVS